MAATECALYSTVEGLPWKVASYNAQRANSHLRIAQVLQALPYTVVALQGTQEQRKVLDKQHFCEWKQIND
eukprot:12371892-Heterocapsa_arctica.AAC.1